MTSTTSTVQDHLDIIQLHHRYAWSLDHRDWTMLEDCFPPTARSTTAMLGGQLQGATVDRRVLPPGARGLDASQHLIGNTMVDLDGDRATATCYFQAQHVFVSDNGSNTYIVAGTYTDELVRDDGTWRIAKRTLTPMWRDGNANVFAEAAARLAAAELTRTASRGRLSSVIASERCRERSPTRSGRIRRSTKCQSPFDALEAVGVEAGEDRLEREVGRHGLQHRDVARGRRRARLAVAVDVEVGRDVAGVRPSTFVADHVLARSERARRPCPRSPPDGSPSTTHDPLREQLGEALEVAVVDQSCSTGGRGCGDRPPVVVVELVAMLSSCPSPTIRRRPGR